MQLRLFAVTITGPDGIATHHRVEALNEKIAEQTAIIAAGLDEIAEICVAIFDSPAANLGAVQFEGVQTQSLGSGKTVGTRWFAG